MGTSAIPSGGGGGLQPKYQKFTSSGTFTLPDGYGAAKPLLVTVQVIGGGGSGTPQQISGAGMRFRGNRQSYFGDDAKSTGSNNVAITPADGSLNFDGRGGGSGGIAQTQMYLTSNLTITVGAAGAKVPVASNDWYQNSNNGVPRDYDGGTQNKNFGPTNDNYTFGGTGAGGTGGTSIAGSVKAAGGNGATLNSISINANATGSLNWNSVGNASISGTPTLTGIAGNIGNGGTPSGTAGEATPLLGTLAGGAGSTTPIFGSFGIGGVRGDGNTNTGVEGTGGGAGAVGAPGAVILTWWQ